MAVYACACVSYHTLLFRAQVVNDMVEEEDLAEAEADMSDRELLDRCELLDKLLQFGSLTADDHRERKAKYIAQMEAKLAYVVTLPPAPVAFPSSHRSPAGKAKEETADGKGMGEAAATPALPPPALAA